MGGFLVCLFEFVKTEGVKHGGVKQYGFLYNIVQNYNKKWFIIKLDSDFDVRISSHLYIVCLCIWCLCLYLVGCGLCF